MTRISFAPLLLLFCVACGDDQAPAEAAELFQRINDLDYRSFATAPGYETPQPSNTQHSDLSQVFINDVVENALNASEPISEWPVGSLIVKDGFEDDNSLDLIAAMEKRDDGWFWAEWLDPPDSDSAFSGKPDVCIDCHSAGSDFVFAFGLPGG